LPLLLPWPLGTAVPERGEKRNKNIYSVSGESNRAERRI
jgi:hypothetical protein